MTGLTADVTVRRGDFTLQVQLSAAPRRITAVLGPNGAGKSSLLQALAGLLAIDDGRIVINDVTVDDARQRLFVPPELRRVGVVFQDLLLFPHLSVLQNVAFGPRSRGAHDPEVAARAALTRLGIADLADRRPEGLSGGQAQRVAMARALATDPDLLLLDEPLAALDAATRIQVRRELRTFLSDFAGTTLLVTHDPLDALVLADDVIVIEGGRITQQGPIATVVRHPRTDYVATLVGVNLVHATAHDGVATHSDGTTIAIADHALSGDVVVIIRPEAVSLHRTRPEGSPRNVWPVTVTSLEARLDRTLVHVAGPPDLAVALTPAAVADLALQPGDQVWASAKALDLDAHPRSAA